eukprot:scaffold916_cov516-Prasinococcus_capsulatus_cf.AAC.4
MRLLGYPAHKISILTTYRGQKHLIRDVINQRCASNPLFGRPGKVTTVDKFQGQQNDYVLLSLVRTRSVGHVRDVRRLVVAMSRARLGLYVFGRRALFTQCYELQPTFKQLVARPTKYVEPSATGQVATMTASQHGRSCMTQAADLAVAHLARRLALVPKERFPAVRKPDDDCEHHFVEGIQEMEYLVYQMAAAQVRHDVNPTTPQAVTKSPCCVPACLLSRQRTVARCVVTGLRGSGAAGGPIGVRRADAAARQEAGLWRRRQGPG